MWDGSYSLPGRTSPPPPPPARTFGGVGESCLWRAEARDAVKHPKTHRTQDGPTTKNDSNAPEVNTTKAKKLPPGEQPLCFFLVPGGLGPPGGNLRVEACGDRAAPALRPPWPKGRTEGRELEGLLCMEPHGPGRWSGGPGPTPLLTGTGHCSPVPGVTVWPMGTTGPKPCGLSDLGPGPGPGTRE